MLPPPVASPGSTLSGAPCCASSVRVLRPLPGVRPLLGALRPPFPRAAVYRQVLCFDFGVELDAVIHEADDATPGAPVHEIWKIEVAANRYDLLCVEGIGRALRTFMGKEPTPVRACFAHSCSVAQARVPACAPSCAVPLCPCRVLQPAHGGKPASCVAAPAAVWHA